MRDLEDEERIKAYMKAKMAHIKMYNECMNLVDGLDVEKFAELVRADEREKIKQERETLILDRGCWERGCCAHDERDGDGVTIEAKLKEKNSGS
jgi:hypothetical protein